MADDKDKDKKKPLGSPVGNPIAAQPNPIGQPIGQTIVPPTPYSGPVSGPQDVIPGSDSTPDPMQQPAPMQATAQPPSPEAPPPDTTPQSPMGPAPVGRSITPVSNTPKPQYHGVKRFLDTIAGATNIGTAIERAGNLGTQGWNAQNEQEQNQLNEEDARKQKESAANLQTAEAHKNEVAANTPMVTVQGPDGAVQMPVAEWTKLQVGREGNQTKQNVVDTQVGAKHEDVNNTNASHEKIADQNWDNKKEQFQKTDQYRRWKANLDNDTRMKVASITANKAPAATVESAIYAQGGNKSLNDAKSLMSALQAKGVMGSLPANWIENWIFGKGAVDPNLDPETRGQIGQLRAALELSGSAMLRAHTGRTSQQIYEDFKNMLGPGQDWSALGGAIDESQGMLQHYVDAASNQHISDLRSGASSTPAAGGPKPIPQGAVSGTMNGKKGYVLNGAFHATE